MQGSKGDIEKREVEELLHATIGDELFRDALEMAKRKQAYIYSKDRRPAVLQRWYLVKLTEECARSISFSRFTMAICQRMNNMEKRTGPKATALPHATIL